jgi:hypothetical protein
MEIFNRIEFLPDTFVSYILRKQPLIIEATAIYSNKNNREFQIVIKHDLSIYKIFLKF